MLYVAYGSNLCKEQMNFRVSGAKVYGKGFINNWKLDFHGNDGSAYATITQATGYKVPVVLWEMSDKQEKVMDSYEGYPKAYYKRKIAVYINGTKKFGIVYIMNHSRRVARPSRKYVNTIRRGYEAFDLDLEYLNDALQRNSNDFYLDDLLEVREFKKIKAASTNKNKVVVINPLMQKAISRGKKMAAGKYSNVSIWKDELEPAPADLTSYMNKTFPNDPYWGSTYDYNDSIDDLPFKTKKHRPSLDDYDVMGT